MSTLIPPRYELPIIDARTMQMSREWYKFLVQLAQAVGGSTSGTEDVQLDALSAITAAESLALAPKSGVSLFEPSDPPRIPDVSLLAWWP